MLNIFQTFGTEQWTINPDNDPRTPYRVYAVHGVTLRNGKELFEKTLIADCNGGSPSEQNKANAILIAAAPDLLTALEAIYQALQFVHSGTSKAEMLTMIVYARGRADAASAKAKGG